MVPGVFLDRDGTLVHPRHYPSRPQDLELFDGIAPGLQRLQAAGFPLIVITNQSGLAHGYFSTTALEDMHHHLATELAHLGVHIDGFYYCPHHTEGVIPELARECSCRKPAPGMLQQAAHDHGIDLQRSWFLGDILDDVEAGNRAGCRTVLVDLGTESPPLTALRWPTYVACDTAHALAIVAAVESLGAEVDLAYRPQSWTPTVEQRPLRHAAAEGGPVAYGA